MNLPEWLRLIVYALAVVRVTHMLWWENGPWDIFDWIRAKAGIEVTRMTFPGTPVPQHVRLPNGFFAELLDCPLCLSVWIAAIAVIGYLVGGYIDYIALWLAIACISMFVFGWHRE